MITLIADLLSKIPLDWALISALGTGLYLWTLHLKGSSEKYKEAWRQERDKNKMLAIDNENQVKTVKRAEHTAKKVHEYSQRLENKLYSLDPQSLNDKELDRFSFDPLGMDPMPTDPGEE